jgi:arginase
MGTGRGRMGIRVELVGVPYTSMAAPGGIARAIDVLRSAGLVERLRAAGDVDDAGDLSLVEGDGVRGAAGLLNEGALARLVIGTRAAVASSQSRGRLPLLVGGDCPVLLGALAAIRDHHGTAGLILVDGHEDAWPPRLSPTGEASDSEVGLALGLVDDPLPEPLGSLVPLLAPDTVAMLGPRDRAEIEEGGGSSLAQTVAMFRDDRDVRADGPSACAREADAAIGGPAAAFWLHLDLDVLSTEQFAAVDYPQPGGLTWRELHEIAITALRAPRCAGASIVIYNPDKDRDRAGAERIVRFTERLVAATGEIAPEGTQRGLRRPPWRAWTEWGRAAATRDWWIQREAVFSVPTGEGCTLAGNSMAAATSRAERPGAGSPT